MPLRDRGETESETHPAEDQPDGSMTLVSGADGAETTAADVVAAIETVVCTTAFLVSFGPEVIEILIPEATEDTEVSDVFMAEATEDAAVDDATGTGAESDATTGAEFDPPTAPAGPN